MSHFNLVHVMKDHRLGARAYEEVIQSVQWGLRQLGHETTYSINACLETATNIVFGGHIAPEIPLNAGGEVIYYNLEQLRDHPAYAPDCASLAVTLLKANVRIWDYSAANIEVWDRLNPRYPVRHVPIGYAPVLSRIVKTAEQDIDVLIYGRVGERRLSVFAGIGEFINEGISVVFASGLWGASRDNLIARAKIVLNINHYDQSRIFEVVRVSYLLANAKAVVADVTPETYIERDIADGVILVPEQAVTETCLALLRDNDRRVRLERQGFDVISRRDIRVFLAAALG